MQNRPVAPKSILITGATSGIGEALALAYAKPGVALALSGRNRERLKNVADRCREFGSEVLGEAIDVTDQARMAAWIGEVDRRAALDLVIANAGILGGAGVMSGEGADQAREIFAVNQGGVLNTVLPAIPLMKDRRRGQIAVMSSLAGFRGVPSAPAYAASKAAVRSFGEGIRGVLAAEGIGVSVICPGFVTSRITDANNFHMPFLMSADKAAGIIVRGLAGNKARIAFPWPMFAGSWLMAALPMFISEGIVSRLPRK